MKRGMSILLVFLAAAALSFAQGRGGAGGRGGLVAGPDNSPKVGEMAPDFALVGGDWRAADGPRNLADFKGKKNVLLMFFPGAFTPGCTQEFTRAGQDHDKITALNVEMIGISRDMPGALSEFKKSVGARNGFVSDADLTISKQYDAVMTTATPNMAKRSYFLIDQTGKIVWKSTNNTLLSSDAVMGALTENLKK
ncbi:MAG TPA: redoxin domain-containing protein [Terriglobia bacterium]|nr:redoxin domain-containing protein [Terriglobia bacterium]